MDMDNVRVWGIHSTHDSLLLDNGIIAIEWDEMGDLSKIEPSKEAFRKELLEVYPDYKKGAVPGAVGMLMRFCFEVAIGDFIVFPSKADRMINIGRVESDYFFEGRMCMSRRRVTWLKHVPRLSFSQGALYEVGSALTFFSVKNYASEFLAALEKGHSKKELVPSIEDETVGATAEVIEENTRDFILKELSTNLKGYPLESFVADLLRAMGYRTTTVSPQGGDGGIDIKAYKDELPPRIVVQVKSQDSDISEAAIQALKGAMMPGDYGLFVTLSNYNKNARKFLEANPMIRGINGKELVDLILQYYESLSKEYREMIPLKKVYIPVPKDKE